MRKKMILIIVLLLFAGCSCWLKKSEECSDDKNGSAAIRLSEFSSQVVYYYRSRKEVVPNNFDENQFIQILRQLPFNQINDKDIDSMVSAFGVKAHSVDGGFSVMLCEKNKGKKVMEDFAGSPGSGCRFDLNSVEIKTWNESKPCIFEANWQQYCKKSQ